ncbi:MAG: DUF3140 domain-containing protein [Acidimicrobiia bacterium]
MSPGLASSLVRVLQTHERRRPGRDPHALPGRREHVHRHLAQRPDGDVTETKWRYSLMNWGHDPLK